LHFFTTPPSIITTHPFILTTLLCSLRSEICGYLGLGRHAAHKIKISGDVLTVSFRYAQVTAGSLELLRLVGDAGKGTKVGNLGVRLQDTRGPADGRHPVQRGGAGPPPGPRKLPVPRSARGIGRAEGVNWTGHSGRDPPRLRLHAEAHQVGGAAESPMPCSKRAPTPSLSAA
jgi:hypothetical protein